MNLVTVKFFAIFLLLVNHPRMCKKGESVTNIATSFTKKDHRDGLRPVWQSVREIPPGPIRLQDMWNSADSRAEKKKIKHATFTWEDVTFSPESSLGIFHCCFYKKTRFYRKKNRIMPGYERQHLILKYYGVLNHSNI